MRWCIMMAQDDLYGPIIMLFHRGQGIYQHGDGLRGLGAEDDPC